MFSSFINSFASSVGLDVPQQEIPNDTVCKELKHNPLEESEARNYLNEQYKKLTRLYLRDKDAKTAWKPVIVNDEHVLVSMRDFDLESDQNPYVDSVTGGNLTSGGPPLVRGQGIVRNCTPQEYFQYIDSDQVQLQRKFDPKLLVIDIKKKFNEQNDNEPMIIRVAFESPNILVSHRDFVFVRDVRRTKDPTGETDIRICNLSCSVRDTKDWPHQEGFVRGFIHYSYWDLQQIPNSNDLKVTYINCVDLSGWIPNYILNIITDDQPLIIKKIAALLGKEMKPLRSSTN
jgi:hypothetical protein